MMPDDSGAQYVATLLAEIRAAASEFRAERATVDAYRAEITAYRSEVAAYRAEMLSRFDSVDRNLQELYLLFSDHRHDGDRDGDG